MSGRPRVLELTDPAITSYTRTRALAELDRIRRGVAVCACGAEYCDSPDGRRAHQILHGHRVTPGATP